MINHHKLLLFAGVLVFVCILVMLAILFDLYDGVRTARVTGQRIRSHKLRITIAKTLEYWIFIIMAFLIDCIGSLFDVYSLPFCAVIVAACLVGIEIKSIHEHACRRRSNTASLPEMIRRIVDATNEKDAREIIKRIAAFIDEGGPVPAEDNTAPLKDMHAVSN